MSVQRVTIIAADEEHEPPDREIDISVIGERVFISVYDGSDRNVPSTRKLAYDVPVLRVYDLIAALSAFGAHVQGVLVASKERVA